MRLAKCFHGLGAIGVEVLAVLLLGWILSVVHPVDQFALATVAPASDQSVTSESLELTPEPEQQADRESYVTDQFEHSAETLFTQLLSHLNELFAASDET